jgi:hypothetical protein
MSGPYGYVRIVELADNALEFAEVLPVGLDTADRHLRGPTGVHRLGRAVEDENR